MKCIITDDEPLARELLENYIADVPNLELVASCKDGIDTIAALKENEVDILFLDIKMPKISGIDLIKTLEYPPIIILTTAYPDYALDGYELDVTDYLLKPFSFTRFLKAVQKAETRLSSGNEETKTLVFRSDKKSYPVETDDIVLIESIGDYVIIHTHTQKITTHETLKSLEEKLPIQRFMRIHKSWIIALPDIDFLEGNMISIKELKIPIGKTYKKSVMERLGGIS